MLGQADGLATRLKKAQSDELEERKRVVAMEEWVSPRSIPIINGPGEPNWKLLASFTRTQFLLQSMNDDETRRASLQLTSILKMAGWERGTEINIMGFSGGRPMPDGVVVSPASRSEQDAADTLADLLWSYNWSAVSQLAPVPPVPTAPPKPNAMFAGTDLNHAITITVGFKPNPYACEQPAQTSENMSEQRKKRRAELKAERKKEGLSGFRPCQGR